MDKLTSFLEQHEGENSLHDLITVFWKHKSRMALIFSVIVVAVTIITILQTPVYKIVSSVMIKYGREYIYHPVGKVDKEAVRPSLAFNSEEIINTEIEIFRSSELIEKVINELGLKNLYPGLVSDDKKENKIRKAIDRFRKDLSVEHIKGSNVIAVSFEHKDPAAAVEAVKLLTELFKEKHLAIFKNPQGEFLRRQVEEYRRKLQDCQDELKTFKQENQIYSLDEQRRFLVQQLVDLNTLLIKGKTHTVALQDKMVSLQEELENVPENVSLFVQSTQEKNINDARRKLLEFKLKENEIRDKYTEDSRLLREVSKKIELVREFLADADENSEKNVRTGKNVIYQELAKEQIDAEVAFNSQLAKNIAINNELELLKNRLQELSEKEIKLKRLQVQVDITEESYKNFMVKLEENMVDNAMDNRKMANVVVIEKPIMPIKPVKPRKKLNILVGIILGAAVSLAYALFAEYVLGNETLTGKK